MSKQKQIGTAGETAVVGFLRAHGWPSAERRILHGTLDQGDVTGTPGVCWEVKSGRAAESASDGQIERWLEETEVERVNSNSDLGVLVTKRKGIGNARPGEWWAHLDGAVFADLVFEDTWPAVRAADFADRMGIPVRLHLAHLVQLLRDAGYGSPR